MRLLVFVLLAVFAANASADPPWQDVAGTVGTYDGWAASGGTLVPVETRIEAREDGILFGTYRFDQDGQIFRGTLSHGRVTGPADLLFIWHDDWGYGVLTLHFEPGFERFTGAWGPLDDGAQVFPWLGIRDGTGN